MAGILPLLHVAVDDGDDALVGRQVAHDDVHLAVVLILNVQVGDTAALDDGLHAGLQTGPVEGLELLTGHEGIEAVVDEEHHVLHEGLGGEHILDGAHLNLGAGVQGCQQLIGILDHIHGGVHEAAEGVVEHIEGGGCRLIAEGGEAHACQRAHDLAAGLRNTHHLLAGLHQCAEGSLDGGQTAGDHAVEAALPDGVGEIHHLQALEGCIVTGQDLAHDEARGILCVL